MRAAKPKGKARSTPKRSTDKASNPQQPAKAGPAVLEVGVRTRRQQEQAQTQTQARAKKPRMQSSTEIRSNTSVQCLPPEVIQVIGSKLDARSLMSARLVCRLWAEHAAAGVTHLSTYVHHDKDEAVKKVKKIKALMPSLNSMTVYLCSRLQQVVGNKFLETLRTLPRLQHLQFTTHHVAEPRWPIILSPFSSFRGLSHLTKLRSLSFIDMQLPYACDLLGLSNLTNLTRLCAPKPYSPSPLHVNGSVLREQLKMICNLPNLQHLELPLTGWHTFSQQLTALSKLTCLKSSILAQSYAEQCEPWSDLWTKSFPDIKELDITLLGCTELCELSISGAERLSDLSLHLTCPAAPDWPARELQYCEQHNVKLRKLVIRNITDGVHEAQLGQLTRLPHLQHAELHVCGAHVHPSPVLLKLAHLSQLTTVIYCRPVTVVPMEESNLTPALERLVEACPLKHLELEGIMASELNSLACLQRCHTLHTLSLKCCNSTPYLLPVSFPKLPRNLEVLKLRFAQLEGVTRHQQFPRGLQELALTSCTVDNAKHLPTFLSSLTSLHTLHLENLSQLKDKVISSLAGLTQLTSLTVMAVTNPDVTNAGLGSLTALVELRSLTWHVGDMLDMTPDVSFFINFKKLQLLSITTSMFYRLSRWSALSMMDNLPQCQLETVGA